VPLWSNRGENDYNTSNSSVSKEIANGSHGILFGDMPPNWISISGPKLTLCLVNKLVSSAKKITEYSFVYEGGLPGPFGIDKNALSNAVKFNPIDKVCLSCTSCDLLLVSPGSV
jgi:hypothetical protein